MDEAHDPVVEGSGETLGEAKWTAMKELEPRFPGITADCVVFEVVEEPAGDVPARVRARVDVEAWREAAEDLPEEPAGEPPARGRGRVDVEAWREAAGDRPDEPAERVRAVVARVAQALGVRAAVDIDEDDE